MIRAYFLFSILVAFLLTVFSYFFVDANLIYLRSLYSGYSLYQRLTTSIIFIILISSFFFFYFLICREIHKNKIKIKIIKKIIILASLILIFSYPAMVSYDIFNYTTTAKVLFGYLENPYIVMPIEFKGDEFLNYTHAANKTALYAPFWLILTGVPYYLASFNFLIMMFGFKLIVGFFYFLTVFLIFKITKDNLSVAFFALNPLVLFETFVSGHNDIVMMFFALLSFYLISKKRTALSGLAFFLSIMIKFATFFLIPVYVYLFRLKLKKKEINFEKIYFASSLLMFLIFLLSPVREEIYPWYFIWVLTFIALTKNIKVFILTSIFSFFLMFRYVPFMYLGTYFGITPYLKIAVTFAPLFFLLGIFIFIYLMSSKRKR